MPQETCRVYSLRVRVKCMCPPVIESFKVELASSFQFAPRCRAPGPGGGRGEHWPWLPLHPDAWEHMET
eukprot:12420849-Karenia_brevis.AAC.1